MSSSSPSSQAAVPPTLRQWMQRTEVQLALCVVGVVGSLLIYGVLQVRSFSQPPTEKGEREGSFASLSAAYARAHFSFDPGRQ
jgi:hypothetical protein